MELYEANSAVGGESLNLMMLGCDMESQEAYLDLLKRPQDGRDEQDAPITDYLVKRLEAEEGSTALKVTVFSNPYNSLTEIP